MVKQQFDFWTVIKLHRGGAKRQSWLCQCVCGTTRVISSHNLKRHHIRSCGCSQRLRTKNPNWNGGKYRNSDGYVYLTRPEGYFGKIPKHGKVLEHRYIMEQHLGRPLFNDENVHHKNGVRTDNRLENLELWTKPQPRGIRTRDAVPWAIEILRRYAPEALSDAKS